MFVNSQAPAETAARLELTSSSAPVGHACSEDHAPLSDCVARTCAGSLNLAKVAASRTSSATSPFVILKSRRADFVVVSQIPLVDDFKNPSRRSLSRIQSTSRGLEILLV